MSTNIRSLKHKTYEDFSGGLNEYASSHQVADNEQIDTANVTTRAGGGIKSRNGVEPYHSMTAELTTPVRNLFRYTKIDGTKQMLAYSGVHTGSGAGTDYVYADDDSGTFTSIARVPTNDGFCRFAQYRDCVFFGTDRVYPHIYNDDETTEVLSGAQATLSGEGAAIPFSGTALGTGGYLPSWNKSYVWRFTYDIKHGDVFLGETEPLYTIVQDTVPTRQQYHQITASFTAENNVAKMTLTKAISAIPAYQVAVSAINIYRSPPLDSVPTAGGAARDHNLYYIGSVSIAAFNAANVGDTLFVDDGGIDFDGQQIRYGRMKRPPRARFITHHKDRMWYGHCKYFAQASGAVYGVYTDIDAPHRIFCSSFDGELPEPLAVHPLAWWDIDPTDGEGITGMISYKNKVLVVFKPNSMWAVMAENTGDKFPKVSIEAISQDVGCVAPESIAIVEGRLVWLSNQGVYYYDGSRPQPLKTDYINPTLFEIPPSAKYRAAGVYHSKEREYWLAHAHPDHEDTHNKHIEKFSLKTGSWSRDDYPYGIGAFVEKKNTDEPLTLLAGADDDSLTTFGRLCGVYKMDVGDADKSQSADTSISWHFQTPFWDCGDPGRDKRFDSVAIHLNSGQDITMDVLVDDRLDTQQDSGGSFTVEAPSTASDLVWGISVWDTGLWGGAREGVVVRSLDSRCWGKRISFRFSATNIGAPIEIQKITIYYQDREGVRR